MSQPPVGTPALTGPTAPDLLELLGGWLPSRRWYPAKGTASVPEPIGEIALVDPEGAASVGLHLFRLAGGAVLQVPLVLRAGAVRHPDAVGTVIRDGAEVDVLDGCADPAFLRAWLALADREPGQGPDLRAGDLDAPGAVRALSGEQSNTSVLLPEADPPAILKVFRLVTPGQNPDVAVPSALHRVGWTGVPRPLGWLTGSWPGADGEPAVTGHLGVVSELVLGARDGFELACSMAAAGTDLAPLARELGRTTAQLHAGLRRALPSTAAPASAAEVLGTLRARAAVRRRGRPRPGRTARSASSPSWTWSGPSAPCRPCSACTATTTSVRCCTRRTAAGSSSTSRASPRPRPSERERPDLALRDLAGMLRSLDYAAAVGGASEPRWLDVGADRAHRGLPRRVRGRRRDVGRRLPRPRCCAPSSSTRPSTRSSTRPATGRSGSHIPLAGVDRLLVGGP